MDITVGGSYLVLRVGLLLLLIYTTSDNNKIRRITFQTQKTNFIMLLPKIAFSKTTFNVSKKK